MDQAETIVTLGAYLWGAFALILVIIKIATMQEKDTGPRKSYAERRLGL